MAETKKKTEGFSAEEKAAMKERARELKASANREEALKDVLAKIGELEEPDRGMATRIHEIITEAAPQLVAKAWYGMPAYQKDGKVVVFYQAAAKFNTRYATLGFSDNAKLDDGNFWPNAYALTKLTAADEKTIAALVKKAIAD